MERIPTLIDLLKQPSTIKGLLGLAGLLGWYVSPEQYQDLIAGIGTLYFIIAIVWQKS